ncbi:MAG: hypothetical protein JSU05_08830 [Bacteroidetes bacterium]|nr:hypothetical protein [Bacteroidota bacterium]
MKNKFTVAVSFLLLFLAACKNNDQPASAEKSEDDVNAATDFIQLSLQGKFDQARKYVLPDTLNLQYADIMERGYKERLKPEDREASRTASIHTHNINKLNDSTTIFEYDNSFEKKDYKLKLVKLNNHWLVDLKYSFQNKPDSTK